MAKFTYVPNRVVGFDGLADGGAIYFYETGSTTPISVYGDPELTTPVSNPYVVPTGAQVPPLYYDTDEVIRVRIISTKGQELLDEDPYEGVTDTAFRNNLNTTGPNKGAALIKTKLDAVGAVDQTVEDVLNTIITPQRFGAVGDGVADDGPALNKMFDHVRTLITDNSFTSICVSGGNGKFRTTESINATGLAAWSLIIRDMFFIGECTGKAVLDLIGTRGYVLDNVSFWGDKTNRPAVALQAQRGTPEGFCDNATYRDVNIDGWFSRAATHDYGQETTKWDHCTVFNRDFTARVSIFEGYNVFPMTSDYASTMTGGTSFINKQFLNCDFRHLPTDENIAFATGITNAANAVVTAPGHSFENGDQVVFQYIAGMTNMNAQIATVSSVTTNTFTVNVDTTSLGTFGGSGNVIRRASVSPIYIARTEGFAMHDCYTVAYGRAPIEIGFPDPGFLRCEQLSFTKMLFEGSGHEAEILFNPTGTCSVQGFELTTYNTHSYVSLLANANPSFTLSFFGFKVQSVDPLFTMSLTNGNAQFAAYDAHILFNSLASVSPETFAAFNGIITSVADGKNTHIVSNEVRLNGQRLRMPGTFGTGSSTPSLGANKPGSNAGPAVWVDEIIDGVTYCRPVWPK